MDYVTQYYKNLSEQLQQRVNFLNKKVKYLTEAEAAPGPTDGGKGGQSPFAPGGYFYPSQLTPKFSPMPPKPAPFNPSDNPPEMFPIDPPDIQGGETLEEYTKRLKKLYGDKFPGWFIEQGAPSIYDYWWRQLNPTVA